MKDKNFTTSFAVTQTPEEVFAAINNVRGWWSDDIDGDTDQLGAVFHFRHKSLHRSTQKITDFVPGKKVVWQVTESELTFVTDAAEWTGTTIMFEIDRRGDKTELRFTHIGLVPEVECFDGCSGAWGFYINESLRALVSTGQGQPERKVRHPREAQRSLRH